MEDIATDRREIGIETQDHFARGLDPLSRDGREQPQQHRLVFEQPPPTAGLHFGDEAIIDRAAVMLRRLRCIVLRRTGIARLGETLIERRRAEARELPKQRQAQRRARGFVQVIADARIETRPKPRVGLRDQWREKLFERTRIGFVGNRKRRCIAAGVLQRRFDPDRVLDP